MLQSQEPPYWTWNHDAELDLRTLRIHLEPSKLTHVFRMGSLMGNFQRSSPGLMIVYDRGSIVDIGKQVCLPVHIFITVIGWLSFIRVK